MNHGRDMLTFQPIEVIKGPTGSLSAILSTAKKSHKKKIQTLKTRINNADYVWLVDVVLMYVDILPCKMVSVAPDEILLLRRLCFS